MRSRKIAVSFIVGIMLLVCAIAHADNFKTLPATSSAMVWDSTTGKLYSIGLAGGKGTPTVLPSLSAPNVFTGAVSMSGGLTITAAGITVTGGNVAIGTNTANAPLTVVGLGTAAPIGTQAAAYVCVDTGGNFYRKATCP